VVSDIFLFFRRLIAAVGDWMSTILPHMVWPYCEFRMQVMKRAARGSLEMQYPKKPPKMRHFGPPHNFVGLYLRN